MLLQVQELLQRQHEPQLAAVMVQLVVDHLLESDGSVESRLEFPKITKKRKAKTKCEQFY